MPLSTNIAAGQAGHDGLHNEERQAINDLQTGKLATNSFANANMTYAAAMALSTRPAVPNGVSIRVFGGTKDDPFPPWFIAGDYRDLFNA